ncbi:MAG: metallophosphoesterase [Clostridia bacterium]|nr:metallophosphoesterase [Clostridia bacterium]
MSLFVIADTHLSLGNAGKSMDVFGGWHDYVGRLKENWERVVSTEDTVVLPGDISWAMDIKDAAVDFSFLDSLPGTKLIGKGNHDYWWATVNKMNGVLEANGISTVKFLFNNAFLCGDISVCGTRGWFFDAQEAEDNAKIIAREAGRLKTSIEEGIRLGGEPVVFTHYPVVMDDKICEPLFEVLKIYGIKRCYFGHIHADRSGRLGDYTFDGVRFSLVSADFLGFTPKKVSLLQQN